ncbi:MAG: hypothetical protein ABUL72_05125, partial [Armatimonadota bacterium]
MAGGAAITVAAIVYGCVSLQPKKPAAAKATEQVAAKASGPLTPATDPFGAPLEKAASPTGDLGFGPASPTPST